MKFLILLVLAALGFYCYQSREYWLTYWQRVRSIPKTESAAASGKSEPQPTSTDANAPDEALFRGDPPIPREGSFVALLNRFGKAADTEISEFSEERNFDLINKILKGGISPSDRGFAANCVRKMTPRLKLLARLDNCRDFGIDSGVCAINTQIPYSQYYTHFVKSMLISVEYNVKYGNRGQGLRDLEFLLRCEKRFLEGAHSAVLFHNALGHLDDTLRVFKRLDLSPEERKRIGALFPTRSAYAAALKKAVHGDAAMVSLSIRMCRQDLQKVKRYNDSNYAKKVAEILAELDPQRMRLLGLAAMNLPLTNFRLGKPVGEPVIPPQASRTEIAVLQEFLLLSVSSCDKRVREQEEYFSANGIVCGGEAAQ